jgi:hypothetical protein
MWDFGAPPLARTLLILVKAELRKTKKKSERMTCRSQILKRMMSLENPPTSWFDFRSQFLNLIAGRSRIHHAKFQKYAWNLLSPKKNFPDIQIKKIGPLSCSNPPHPDSFSGPSYFIRFQEVSEPEPELCLFSEFCHFAANRILLQTGFYLVLGWQLKLIIHYFTTW